MASEQEPQEPNEEELNEEGQEATDESQNFRCEHCGKRTIVERKYKSTTNTEEIIPCECGADEEGIAATRQVTWRSDHKDWGYFAEEYFTDEGEVEWEKNHESDDPETSDPAVLCEECYQAEGATWEPVAGSEATEVDDESEVVRIVCRHCRREVVTP